MEYKFPIIIIVFILAIIILLFVGHRYNKNMFEFLTSDEAIQNVASIYNGNQMSVSNITATTSLTSSGVFNLGNGWSISSDGNGLYFKKAGLTNPALVINNDGSSIMNYNLTNTSSVNVNGTLTSGNVVSNGTVKIKEWEINPGDGNLVFNKFMQQQISGPLGIKIPSGTSTASKRFVINTTGPVWNDSNVVRVGDSMSIKNMSNKQLLTKANTKGNMKSDEEWKFVPYVYNGTF